MIHSFPKEVRKAWDSAGKREFFAGYRVGEEPFCFTEHIELDTLKAAVEVGASIRFALYPAEPTDKDYLPKDFPTS